MNENDDVAEYTVGTVAAAAGVSVRTLHHYDEIGLLEPSERSAAGYRLYSTDDLERLQRVLFYRELDFDLPTIADMLADSGLTDEVQLRHQRDLLTGRITRQQAMVAAIDEELEARKRGLRLTAAERFEVFGRTRLEDDAARAEKRWGGTDGWRQRQERVSAYGKQDWLTIRAEQSDIHQRLHAAMAADIPATDPAVMEIAEEHRQHLERWFYDCDPDTHRRLAIAYRDNERVVNLDDFAPGLSRYSHDAMVANADRIDAGSAT